MEVKSFEDLARVIRSFETWEQKGGYDLVGMVHLLGAAIDNLRQHANQEEFGDILECLEPNHSYPPQSWFSDHGFFLWFSSP